MHQHFKGSLENTFIVPLGQSYLENVFPLRNDAGQPLATDPQKKLRNLKKKLRDIEALEEKLNSGEIPTPEKEQLEKVNLGIKGLRVKGLRIKGLVTHLKPDFLPDCII